MSPKCVRCVCVVLCWCGYEKSRGGESLHHVVEFLFTDALFGLIAELLREVGEELQTPADVANFLHKRLAPIFAARGEDFRVVNVTAARDIQAILPWQMKLEGAYNTVRGVEAPHSFMFLPRSGVC